MRFAEAARFESDLFGTTYVVGRTEDGLYVYVWAPTVDDDEIPETYVTDATCDRGAVVGSIDEVIEELETCVGSFRYWGAPDQADEATAIVDRLTGALCELEAIGA